MANRDGRGALRGAEEEAFDLLVEAFTWTTWEKLVETPLNVAARWVNRSLAEKMVRAKAVGRGALRGEEEEAFDLLAAVLTSEQWAALLTDPLEHAAFQGDRGLAQKLVGAGAEIGNALHAAVRGDHEEIVNDLLQNGASLAAKDRFGNTPLHCAAREGKTEMVQLLLFRGADEDALDDIDCTPLFLAVFHGNVGAALALVAAGADVNRRYSERKRSIVHLAAREGTVKILNAVIQRGADVDAVDTDEHTPLHHAARHNNAGAINMLVGARANIEARDDEGCTPLHHAADRISLEALSALLKHGAHVNAQNGDEDTPLHWASAKAGIRRAAKVVDLLLRSGADETILDDDGKAAADMIGRWVEEEDLGEDVNCVHFVLENATTDRIWRRRGYLVVCRAHPDRMRQIQDFTSADAAARRRARSRAERGRAEMGNWAVVVARVLGLQEEIIFRTIVEYL